MTHMFRSIQTMQGPGDHRSVPLRRVVNKRVVNKRWAAALSLAVLSSVLLGAVTAAQAHEYWVEPQGPAVLAPGDAMQAEFKVGTDFKGSRNSYIPRNIQSLVLAAPDGSQRRLGGELGQRPAVDTPAEQAGTHVVGLVTTRSKLTWRERERFVGFIEYEGLPGILERHAARGLPDIGFVETYARSAKALFQVGPGALKDQALGMPLEVVLLDHDREKHSIRLQVLDKGQPLPGNQVRLFHRLAPDQEARQTIAITDADGQARFDVSGGGQFMLNTVTLREPSAPIGDEVWHSWWGSLSFNLPSN